MIVRRVEHPGRAPQLLLIRQLDHSALSGEFARRWGRPPFVPPEPLESVVLAASRHDEGWREADMRPLYDERTKGPASFRGLEVRRHIPFYREGIHRIAALDPYAGLLVSMHGSGIYQGRYGAGPIRMTTQTADVRAEMEAFVEEQEAFQASLKRGLWAAAGRRRTFEAAVWCHYELLQVWDLLSLFVCIDRDRTPVQRIAPAPTRPGGDDLALEVVASGDQVRVRPWPFTVKAIDAAVPARAIPDRPYASEEEVRGAMDAAEELAVPCHLVPG
ncbi:MAG TPA: DUF3891 family protein [bacterium]|nr:DUF3891 family protein [bacterium]